MYKDENDNVRLKSYENSDEPQNSFMFVMKANVRCIEGLRHVDDTLTESVSGEIVKQYVDGFNGISLGKVYIIHFNNRTNIDLIPLFDSNVIYGDITKEDIDTICYTATILKQRLLQFIL